MRTWMMSLCALALLLVTAIGGCTVFSSADRARVDHRAAVMAAAADKINGSTVEELSDPAVLKYVAHIMENERRAAVNISDAAHFRKPTYRWPAKAPTTMPWVPIDDKPAAGEGGGD